MNTYYTVTAYNAEGMTIYMASGKSLKPLIAGISASQPHISSLWANKLKASDVQYPEYGQIVGAKHTVNFTGNAHLSKIEAFYTVKE